MMIQPTEREMELRRLMNQEKDPEKRKKIREEIQKEFENNPIRQRLKNIFA
nr:MAG TPA: hypothetical protein [Caudoviricetes sp.]